MWGAAPTRCYTKRLLLGVWLLLLLAAAPCHASVWLLSLTNGRNSSSSSAVAPPEGSNHGRQLTQWGSGPCPPGTGRATVDSWYTTRQCCPCPRNTYNTGAEVVCVVSSAAAAAAAAAAAPCIQQLRSWHMCLANHKLTSNLPSSDIQHPTQMHPSQLFLYIVILSAASRLRSRALSGPTRPTQAPPHGTPASASTAIASPAAAAAQTAQLTTTWSRATCSQAWELACRALLAGSAHAAVWGRLLASQHVSSDARSLLSMSGHSVVNDSTTACCTAAEGFEKYRHGNTVCCRPGCCSANAACPAVLLRDFWVLLLCCRCRGAVHTVICYHLFTSECSSNACCT
jgi:hypothetical protein